jgi:hypothetical protein
MSLETLVGALQCAGLHVNERYIVSGPEFKWDVSLMRMRRPAHVDAVRVYFHENIVVVRVYTVETESGMGKAVEDIARFLLTGEKPDAKPQ